MAAELTAESFWSRVDKRGPDECWEWLSGKQHGYGRVSRGYSHRLAWQFTRGSIPKGLCVCHRCDNRGCCNSSHMFLGTISENILDMVKKNRQARGERNGLAKLTDAQVLDIRANKALCRVTNKVLAERFNVSQALVSMIVNNRHRVSA